MPEGPSLIMFREELAPFIGKKITAVGGSTKIEKERMKGLKILDLRTWGKHLIMEFDPFFVRFHFLMFGTYYINSEKDRVPRLLLQFGKQYINFYSCGVKMVEEPVEDVYDWQTDIMSEDWNARRVNSLLKKKQNEIIADALMDQEIFTGVGNIIKNEVLWRVKVNPLSVVKAIPDKVKLQIVKEAKNYGADFLKWRREGILTKNWKAHKKKICERDGSQILKTYAGELERRSFYCENCQKLYT